MSRARNHVSLQGRHAVQQWQERKEADVKRRQKKAEEREKEKAEKEAAGEPSDQTDKNSDDGEGDVDDKSAAADTLDKPEEVKRSENIAHQVACVPLPQLHSNLTLSFYASATSHQNKRILASSFIQ